MSTVTATESPRAKRGIGGTLADIYHERTDFDFIGNTRRWLTLSGILIVIALGAFVVNGLNLGIDFEGGTQWQFTVARGGASSGDVRDTLPGDLQNAKVLIVGGDTVRVQAEEQPAAVRTQVTRDLARYAGIERAQVSVSDVGPTWGDRVSRKALQALVAFFLLISIYLTLRFEWKMALAAIIAVVHDIVLTVGIYAVTGFEVTPATVVAFLTILGFSLYDTVVVFDKVKENTPTVGIERADTYSKMANRSMNQVLMRSLNTSFVALLPVASLLIVGSGIFGAITLREFALALFVGLLTGAYSSIFVAAPILAWLKEREPRYQAVRERARAQAAREETAPARRPVAAAARPRPSASAGPRSGRPAAARPAPTTGPGPEPAAGDGTEAPPPAPAGRPAAPATAGEVGRPGPAESSEAPAPSVSPVPPVPPATAPARPAGPVAPRPRQQRRRKRR